MVIDELELMSIMEVSEKLQEKVLNKEKSCSPVKSDTYRGKVIPVTNPIEEVNTESLLEIPSPTPFISKKFSKILSGI